MIEVDDVGRRVGRRAEHLLLVLDDLLGDGAAQELHVDPRRQPDGDVLVVDSDDVADHAAGRDDVVTDGEGGDQLALPTGALLLGSDHEDIHGAEEKGEEDELAWHSRVSGWGGGESGKAL